MTAISAATVKERPILFSAPMVRAILAGRKTQTRRVLKSDCGADSIIHVENVELYPPRKGDAGYTGWVAQVDKLGALHLPLTCPYGAPGDRLWVRETHYIEPGTTAETWERELADVLYAADYADPDGVDVRWRPSIHMPRWVSRLTLEITGVRVERLQSISEADAIAEGAQCPGVPAAISNVGAYAKLWNVINGDGAWELNPWVWVVTFNPVSGDSQ